MGRMDLQDLLKTLFFIFYHMDQEKKVRYMPCLDRNPLKFEEHLLWVKINPKPIFFAK